jgi:hypothetical protein
LLPIPMGSAPADVGIVLTWSFGTVLSYSIIHYCFVYFVWFIYHILAFHTHVLSCVRGGVVTFNPNLFIWGVTYGVGIFCIHPTARDLRRQQIRKITKKQNGVSLQSSVTGYLTTQLIYNSILNNTVSFKAFQIIIIHSYLSKYVF